jgi:two-component system, sensor histidine kinase PdtaS
MRDEAGQLAGLDELRHSLERFQNVVESAPNMFVMVNRAGRIEMVNLQAERVFGYTRDELMGQPVEMLIPSQPRGQHRRERMLYFAQPMARPMGAGRDLYAVKMDGTEFPVEIGLNPVATAEGTMVLAASSTSRTGRPGRRPFCAAKNVSAAPWSRLPRPWLW